MTLSPIPQIVHCPLSRPPRPAPPPSPSIPCAAAGIVGCCCCCSSARTSSPAPHHHHHHHHHHHLHQLHHLHYNHHHHHQHRRHQHRHHRSQWVALGHSLPPPSPPPPSPRQHSCSEVLHGRVTTSQPGCPADRRERRSTQDCREDRWRLSRRRWGCGGHPLAAAPSKGAVTAAAPLPPEPASSFSSETWRWCRSLLVLPALLVLLLLPYRRKSRRCQLTQVPRLLLTLCLLTMVAGRCLASPWIEENANSVKLRAKVCQPVSEEHLRSMLGTAYDPSRMSSQDPTRTADKRSDPSSAPEMEEAAFDSYYMEDDPGAGEYVDEDFVDIVSENGEEEEQDWFRREEEEEDGVEVEKDFEAEERFYHKKRVGNIDSAQSDQPRSRSRSRGDGAPSDPDQLYLYMKRRRRASGSSRDLRSGGASSDRDKQSKDSLLPLRLLLSGKNRKLRRKLKKVFRKKAKKLGKKPPPWNCNMTKVWGRLKEGYFPRYLLDGRCATDKCFYRLYDCVPQKYRVKVLKRDPDYCNPLPALGANTTYEQKWSVVRYYVTVGCNCQAADPMQRSRSGRRRNS